MTDLKTRELLLLGDDWKAVLAVDMPTVRRLFALADPETLYGLHRLTDKARSWDILVGEDSLSLWLDETRLSEVER